jgi:hypothetical protein
MSKNINSQNDQNIEWLYDCVVQYISSPIFRNSLKDFIDENCISFDMGDENPFEYTSIHNVSILIYLEI